MLLLIIFKTIYIKGDYCINGMNESIKNIIKEELTKQDVNSMINDKLSVYIKKYEMTKEVKKIVSDVMEEFFKMMYNKRGFWKNNL